MPVAADGRAVVPVETNAEGLVCLPSDVSGTLRVQREGYRASEVTVLRGDASPRLEPVLLWPWVVAEVTVRAAGEPVPGADVAWRTLGTPWAHASTDQWGRVSAPMGVVGDSLDIAAGAEGYAAGCQVVPRLDVPLRVGIDLVKPGRVKFRVVDASERAIAEVVAKWVRDLATHPCEALLDSRGWQKVDLVSDTERTFVWSDAPPGRGQLVISAPGYRDRILGALVIEPGKTHDLGVLTLAPGHSVSGTVEFRSGKRAADVRVRVYSLRDGSKVIAVTRSDAEGKFEMDLETGDRIVIWAGELPGPLSEPTLHTPGPEPVQVILPDSGALRGTVRTTQGERVPTARIRAVPLDPKHEASPPETSGVGSEHGSRPASPGFASVVTDSDGAFLIEGLAPGSWRIDAVAAGFVPEVEMPLALKEGATVEVDLHLDPGVEAQGTVLSSGDDPVPGATVRYESSADASPGAVTDVDGRFRLRGVPNGVLRFEADHPALGTGWVMADSRGAIEIRLTLRGGVEGYVRSASDGPVEGTRLEVQGVGLTAVTDAAGWYVLADVPAGRRRIVLRRALLGDQVHVQARDVEVIPGETVRADFNAGCEVVGRVTVDDEPLNGALVTFTHMQEDRASGNPADAVVTAVTDSSGEYRVTGLSEGRYTVRARYDGMRLFREVRVADGHVNRADLVLQGVELEGLITDAESGLALRDAEVTVFDPRRSFGVLQNVMTVPQWGAVETQQVSDAAIAAMSDIGGQFRMKVPPGRFTLEVRKPGYQSVRRPLQTGEVATADRDQVVAFTHTARRDSGRGWQAHRRRACRGAVRSGRNDSPDPLGP